MRRPIERQVPSAEILALLIAVLFASPLVLSAADLNQQTLQAWEEYVQGTNSQMKQRLTGTGTFLWIDEAPGRRERVRAGEILVEPGSKNNPQKVPQGLIHDWLGAVFIPNATITSVLATLNDYGRYDQFYNPTVIEAKLLNASGAVRNFSLVLAEKAPFVTAAIASEYNSRIIRIDKSHWYTVTYSTRVQQIDNFGEPGAHELPPDQGAGYIWRLFSIERFEEQDGGVYAELEALALSRNIPFEIQWIVKPILQHLPRNSMTATLQKTREAVWSEASAKAAPPATNPPSVVGSKKPDATTAAGHSLTIRPISPAAALRMHVLN
jgi:hypothetical protein